MDMFPGLRQVLEKHPIWGLFMKEGYEAALKAIERRENQHRESWHETVVGGFIVDDGWIDKPTVDLNDESLSPDDARRLAFALLVMADIVEATKT